MRSHLWLPRHMELPHAYIARTTWGGSRRSRARSASGTSTSSASRAPGKSTTLFNLAMHDIVSRRRGRRHRPPRRPGRGGRGLHPTRAHACGLLLQCRRHRASGRASIRWRRCRPSAMRSPPPAWSPPSSTCGATVGDRALNISYFTASWLCLRARGHAHRLTAPLYRRAISRAALVARVRDPITARFWTGEYPQYDERYRAEAAGPILNKVGQLAASPALRDILGQHAPKFDLSLCDGPSRHLHRQPRQRPG